MRFAPTNKRCLAATAALFIGVCAVRSGAGQEAEPEQLEVDFSAPSIAPIEDFAAMTFVAPTNSVLDSLPAATLPVTAPNQIQQLSLFGSIPQAAISQDSKHRTAIGRTVRPAVEKIVSAISQQIQPFVRTMAQTPAAVSPENSVNTGSQIQAAISGEDDVQGETDINSADTAASGVAMAGHGNNGGPTHSIRASIPWMPAHPAEFYKEAYDEAQRFVAAYYKRSKIKDDDVQLGEIMGSFSRRVQPEISYAFYVQLPKAEKNSVVIYVDFSRDWAIRGQRMGSPRARIHNITPEERPAEPCHVDVAKCAVHIILSPEAALDAARAKFPKLDADAGYILHLHSRDKGKDFWYDIYDSKGNAVAVNARTSRVVRIKRNQDGGELVKEFIPADKKLTGDDIEKVAQRVIGYKGMPWSKEDYLAKVAEGERALNNRGATQEQIEKYRRLCDEAPIKKNQFARAGVKN